MQEKPLLFAVKPSFLPGFSESKGVEPLNVGVEMNFSASAMAFSEHLRIDKTGGNTYN